MFFYTDESVFEKVKKYKTRDRLVRWADEFFDRYDLILNPFPIQWNESVYKKSFCLSKTRGLKGISILDGLIELISTKLELMQVVNETDFKSVDKPSEEDIFVYDQNNKRLIELYNDFNCFLRNVTNNELDFRNAVQDHIKKNFFFGSIQKQFVHVIFCDFITKVSEISPSIDAAFDLSKDLKTIKDETIAMTLNNEINKLLIRIEKGKKDKFNYIFPIIIIDVNSITKSMNYVLAHELVHAAGGTTKDNTGSSGNIMIYADAEGKMPKAVKLEENDKKRIELSFFAT